MNNDIEYISGEEYADGSKTPVSFDEEADYREFNDTETDCAQENAAEADYMDELMQSKKLENQQTLAEKRGQDERAMIREQERLAQERRRRKRHKRRNIIVAAAVVVLAAGVWFIGWGYNLIFGTSAAASAVEIVVESGQVVVYAKLTSVKGNEITYTVAEAVETDGADAGENLTDGDASTDSEISTDAADGEAASGFGDGEMPKGGTDGETGMSSGVTDGEAEAGFGNGGMPDGFSFDSDSLPEGFDSDSLPDGFSFDSVPGAADTDTQTQDSQSSSTGSVKAETMALNSTEASAGSSTATVQTSSLTAVSAGSNTATSLSMGGGRSDMGGDMSSMGDMMGGASSDFSSFDFGSFGGAASGTVTSSATDTFTYNSVTYQLTDETNTTLIPVGTDVTTRLGTVTTFARLSAGDCVALVMQEVDGEDVIMAVYIIG